MSFLAFWHVKRQMGLHKTHRHSCYFNKTKCTFRGHSYLTGIISAQFSLKREFAQPSLPGRASIYKGKINIYIYICLHWFHGGAIKEIRNSTGRIYPVVTDASRWCFNQSGLSAVNESMIDLHFTVVLTFTLFTFNFFIFGQFCLREDYWCI